MIGSLPESISVGGKEYFLRSDYRNVLQVFTAFVDPDMTGEEKWIVATYLLLEDFDDYEDVLTAVEGGLDMDEVAEQIKWFLSADAPEKEILEKAVYDWEKDEQMIFSAVNKVAGVETRELEYLHWWTFLGYFNEIGEGNFSFIVGIRDKLNHRKKLEKHEKEFLRRNGELVKLARRKTKEELVREAERRALLDEVL